MQINSNITKMTQHEETVRGKPLADLMKVANFSDAIFFLLTKKEPSKEDSRMFAAILTSVIDHGAHVASAMNARISASAKNPIHASVAAGVLGFGERHGLAVEPAMRFFYNHIQTNDVPALLKDRKAKKHYVPGYGHKFYTDIDPRAQTLFEIAQETGSSKSYSEFAKKIEVELNAISSKPLPLNVDGAIAAILCDMGFDAKVGNGVFLIGRVPGLIAHIIEEQEHDVGVRRLFDEE